MSSSRFIGIDLGTTFSAVATLDDRGQPVTLTVQHADGSFTLPNDAGNIGQEALDRFKTKNAKTSSAK